MSDNVMTGAISAILPAEEISNGQYRKQVFAITNNSGYEGKEATFAFEIFEKAGAEKSKIDNFNKFNSVGDVVDVSYEIRCNENKGRYFTSLSAWKVFRAEGQATEAPDAALEEEAPF
jgi:hypothetical protein